MSKKYKENGTVFEKLGISPLSREKYERKRRFCKGATTEKTTANPEK
jgi:hypothetical protein